MKKKFVGLILIFILLVLSFGVYKMNENSKIEKANISAYAYLEGVLDCETIANINLVSGKIVSEFKDEDCHSSALKNLEGISFERGELASGKLILESEEFANCTSLYREGGAVEYKNCIYDAIPLLKEKYPEIA